MMKSMKELIEERKAMIEKGSLDELLRYAIERRQQKHDQMYGN